MSRRGKLGVGASVCLLALLVPVGRWERAAQRADQTRAIRGLMAIGGPRLAAHLSATRLAEQFDCLSYRVGARAYAVELCFSSSGHVVEAIDRRGDTPAFWSFRFDPSAGPAVPVRTLLARFHDAGVLRNVPVAAAALPVGFPDTGPELIRK